MTLRVLRIRTELVALDEDLGAMVACYDANTGELLAIGVDPPKETDR